MTSHVELLSNGLRKLELQQSETNPRSNDQDGDPHSENDPSAANASRLSRSQAREGYGFRPPSGISTPLTSRTVETGSPLPDPHGLGWPAKSTVSRLNETTTDRAAREKIMVSAVRTILECIGEDPDREGLLKTPERFAQAMMWMTRGYEERLADVINDAVFAEDHDEMVLVREIDFSSLCEHHLVPFTGKVCGPSDITRATDLHKSHSGFSIGCYRVHPKSASAWAFQACAHCRNFQSSSAGSRKVN
jgi:GTP cyclohydrolase I